MRAVIQRVSRASVSISNSVKSSIGNGLLVLLGIHSEDSVEDVEWLSSKIVQLRIFSDPAGLMNLSLADVNGEILLISQFTLHASTKKGNRPSFISAASAEMANELYEKMLSTLRTKTNKNIKSGEFGAMMDVDLVNSGPVTIIIDTRNKE